MPQGRGKTFPEGSSLHEQQSFPPGQHGKSRRFKMSDYGVQLREKQKLRRIYGVLEKQFSLYYQKAAQMKGITGTNLLILLESRLDNVVYRLGMATSRSAARQMVMHGHFTVNDRVVDIPNFHVKPGDTIQVREKSRKKDIFHASVKRVKEGKLLPWFELDKARLSGRFLDLPKREDIPVNINESLIVELYSK
jgi:small subunit ribosomal protein S4